MTPHEIYKAKMEELENERIFDCADVKEYSTKTTIAVLEAVREECEMRIGSFGDLSTFITQQIDKIQAK